MLTNSQVRIYSRPIGYRATVILQNDFGAEDIFLCEHNHPDHESAITCGESWLRERLEIKQVAV